MRKENAFNQHIMNYAVWVSLSAAHLPSEKELRITHCQLSPNRSPWDDKSEAGPTPRQGHSGQGCMYLKLNSNIQVYLRSAGGVNCVAPFPF